MGPACMSVQNEKMENGRCRLADSEADIWACGIRVVALWPSPPPGTGTIHLGHTLTLSFMLAAVVLSMLCRDLGERAAGCGWQVRHGEGGRCWGASQDMERIRE